MKAGVALNPHTPAHLLSEIVTEADFILIMSVNPGFGGQKFIDYSVDKIRELREMADKSNPDLIIQIDGGVDETNIRMLKDAGADCFVAGSAVFKNRAMIENLKVLREQLS